MARIRCSDFWKKNKEHILQRIALLNFTFCFFLGFTQAQPTWVSNYPKVISGASSADLWVQTSEKGTFYYAVYNTLPSYSVTASRLKQDAMGSGGGSIVRNGAVSIAAANKSVAIYLSGMPDNTTYYFYMVAEGDTSGLQPDASIKIFKKTFPKKQTSNSFRSKFGPNALVGYLAYVPEAYYKNPTDSFPLLLMLHGQGEKIWNPQNLSQLDLVRKYGPAMLIDQGQEFPFIVITPQCPFQGWDDVTVDGFQTTVTKPGQFVNEIYDYVESKYRINHKKEYLTGISMGGAGVWSFLSLKNDRVAAAIPISGWGDPSTGCTTASQNVAIWAFQGALDGAGGILSLLSAINTCKPAPSIPAKATIYAGLGHEVWDITYNNTGPGIAPDNIYNWLMRYTKSAPPAPAPNTPPVANAGTDQTIVLPTSTATLTGKGTDTDGTILGYAWAQKSGDSSTILSGATSATLTVSGLMSGTYVYTLTVTDNAGAKASDDVTLTVTQPASAPPPVPEDGTGLYAEYFTNKSLTAPAFLTEIDTTINFNWGNSAPQPTLPVDQFSVRWSGTVVPNYSETYTFYTTSDDGMRAWINDVLVINNWVSHAATENSGKIALTAGVQYAIKVEYYELWMAAVAKLSWSSPSQAKQIIPKNNLYPVTPSERRDETDVFGTAGKLSVYPIPAKGTVHVQFFSSQSGESTFELRDEISTIRYKTSVPSQEGDNTATLDVSSLAAGFYILSVQTPDKTTTSRIVISK